MYLIKSFDPDPRVVKEARSLIAAGHEVTVLALDHHREHPRESVVESIHVLHVRGLPWRGKPGPLKVLLLALNVLWYTLRSLVHTLAGSYRVFHCHDLNTLHIGWLARLLLPGRLVYDSHECYPLLLRGLWRPLGPIGRLAERILGRGADLVVSASRLITQSLAVLGKPTIEVLNYVDLAWFDRERSRPSPLDGATRGPILLYQGIVKERRGVEELIRARNRFRREPTIVVAGQGPDLPRLRGLFAGDPGVVFLGPLPYDRVPALVSASDVGTILVLPHFQYVYVNPNKLYEYMAGGLPVLASRVPDMDRIVGETGCGFVVDPTDPGEIASAVNRLLEDPGGARRMGEAGRRAIETRYNWEGQARRLVAAYEGF